jgi:drug/metabolite transporter (DMT)-like permease
MTFGAPLPARAQRRVAIPFIVCTMVWGSTWFVIGSQLHYVPAGWSIAYRFGLASIAMFIVAASMRVRIALPAAGHRLAMIVGLTQFMLNYAFVYAAEEKIASGLVALVSALLIVPNALFARAFLGQAVSRRFLIGSAVAMAGIALLFAHEMGRSAGDSHRVIMGVVLSLAGVLSASTANVLQATKRAVSLPPPSLLAWGMVYGTALDVAWASISVGPPSFSLAPVYIAGLLYLALAGSAVTFSLYFGLIRQIGPARAGYIAVLVPVIAMLLSTLFEGYQWTATAAAGALLTIAGLVVAMRARSPR